MKEKKKKIKKGKMIGTWMNPQDERCYIKKFGKVPDSEMIKKHLKNEPIKVIEINPNDRKILYELGKIGTNINQITLKINQNPFKYYAQEVEKLDGYFNEIREIMKLLSSNKYLKERIIPNEN